ncbi:nuclear RNA-splicing-associated protein-domain-containing protein [Phycomyces nitens]|nr:nuclear RNA-splicing-associated protein-domain-containing protein [Phycomyces nitens]
MASSNHHSRSPTRRRSRYSSNDTHKHKHKHKHSHDHDNNHNHNHKRKRSRSPARNLKGVDDPKDDIDVLAQLKKLAQKHNKPKETKKSSVQKRAPMVPKTKESWEKERLVIKREYDPQTGRTRLVRATGEILETIVSREQQYQINKAATIGDGIAYQTQIAKKC